MRTVSNYYISQARREKRVSPRPRSSSRRRRRGSRRAVRPSSTRRLRRFPGAAQPLRPSRDRGSHCHPAHPHALKTKPRLPKQSSPCLPGARYAVFSVHSVEKAPVDPRTRCTRQIDNPALRSKHCLARLPLQCHLPAPLEDQGNFQRSLQLLDKRPGRHLLHTSVSHPI